MNSCFGNAPLTGAQKNIMAGIALLSEEYVRLQAARRKHEKKGDDVVNAWIREHGIIGKNGNPANDFYDLSQERFDELREELDAATFAAGLTDKDGYTLPEHRTLDREREISKKIKSLCKSCPALGPCATFTRQRLKNSRSFTAIARRAPEFQKGGSCNDA
jgi:hypothetical protein